jgi:tRNA pseudouridine38-40 synthase
MKRYAICLAYLPTLDYSGFSNQLHDPQNIFTLVFSAFKKARLITLGLDPQIRYASRTDRGVGALSQVIVLNTKQIPILSEINSYLPDSIRALSFTGVSTNFHPRRDAQLRTYSYFLTVNENFNLSLARKTLEMLVGRHNFHNFAKKDSTKEINTIKDIQLANILIVGDNTYQIRLSSKSFLWQQIRRIISHMIEVSTGLHDLENTRQLLGPKPAKFKPAAAPPSNLILEDIQYQDVKFSYDQKALRSFISILKEQLLAAKAKSVLYEFMSTHLHED